ncbi:MAG TPA: metalloregulator ArsR/SmtB family transcription factor [Gemmatimonadaceae bacterium]
MSVSILDRISALADPTRSRILLLLDGRELMVGELCAVLQLPQSTVSRHLKILSDETWVVARGEGTSRFYSMVQSRLEPATKRLWHVVREQFSAAPSAAHDIRRLEGVLAQRVATRRSRSQAFFSSSHGTWDEMRSDMIGTRTDLLALLELCDERWVVGDLGCGAGHVSELLAPCVARVIAVDESGPMLSAARARLGKLANVDLRTGAVEELPIENGELDVALLFLVAHFVADPTALLREVQRVLKPGGKLLFVDFMIHDRADYAIQLGHVWQGFDEPQIVGWLEQTGFVGSRFRALPADTTAKGPSLFAAAARKKARKNGSHR